MEKRVIIIELDLLANECLIEIIGYSDKRNAVKILKHVVKVVESNVCIDESVIKSKLK